MTASEESRSRICQPIERGKHVFGQRLKAARRHGSQKVAFFRKVFVRRVVADARAPSHLAQGEVPILLLIEQSQCSFDERGSEIAVVIGTRGAAAKGLGHKISKEVVDNANFTSLTELSLSTYSNEPGSPAKGEFHAHLSMRHLSDPEPRAQGSHSQGIYPHPCRIHRRAGALCQRRLQRPTVGFALPRRRRPREWDSHQRHRPRRSNT